MSDPFAHAQAQAACPNCEGAGCAECVGQANLEAARQPDYIDRIEALDRAYGGANLRLQCLSMASYAPDGAAAPPIAEVMARAEAYWRFVQGV